MEEARILPRIPRKNAYHKPDISTQTSWHTFHKSTRVGDQLEINRRCLQLRVLSELSVGGRIASFLFSRGDLPMSGSVRTRCRGRIASFLICRRDMFMRNEVVFLRPYPGKDIGLRWVTFTPKTVPQEVLDFRDDSGLKREGSSHEEIEIYGRADCLRPQAGGGWYGRRRGVPEDGHLGEHLLSLEEEVLWNGSVRTQRSTPKIPNIHRHRSSKS